MSIPDGGGLEKIMTHEKNRIEKFFIQGILSCFRPILEMRFDMFRS
jgi:hypothetical protein